MAHYVVIDLKRIAQTHTSSDRRGPVFSTNARAGAVGLVLISKYCGGGCVVDFILNGKESRRQELVRRRSISPSFLYFIELPHMVIP